MKINCEYTELVQTHKLVPHVRNANMHGQKQIDILSKIIDFQGWRHPIIVSKLSGFIVVGHGRLEAAKKLGYTEVPVSYQEFDNEAQEIAFLISDNKSATLAEHDDSLMIETIKDLDLLDMDFDLLGMPNFNFMRLLDGEIDIDDKPAKDTDDAKKYKIEVQFSNDMEMMDIHDDLLHRGYIVRVL